MFNDVSGHELQRVTTPARPQTMGTDVAMPAADIEDDYSDERALLTAESGDMAAENAELQQSVVRKLDRILLPFLALLFLLNSLDKSNIGNAETAGFTHDVGLSRSDINTSLAVFFFVFVLLQPVGAALGRTFGMARYVPCCMSLWGLSTMLHIVVRTRGQLIALRIAIAMLESGFYPTTVSYMSTFYTKYEFATRLGLFYGMSAMSGAIGGVLSWAIFSRFPGSSDTLPSRAEETLVQSWRSWQVLFLVEGFLTMLVALVGFVWLPHSAGTAWFLNAKEKRWAEERMQVEHVQPRTAHPRFGGERISHQDEHTRPATSSSYDSLGDGEAHHGLLEQIGETSSRPMVRDTTTDTDLSRQEIVAAVFNLKIFHLLFVNILSAMPASAFGVLLPILVKELSPTWNLSPAESNLLSAPPFVFGAIVLLMFTAWSDRSRQRMVPILWALGLLLVGLTLAVLSPNDQYWLRYLSLCVLLSGSFVASPLTVAWLANNTPEPGKRAILLGINGWGNLAGVSMAVLFTPEEEPGYTRSFTILLIGVACSFAGYCAFRFMLVRTNRWREMIIRDWSKRTREREESFGDVPAPESFERRVSRRLGIHALAQRLGLEAGRKGDQKLTFRYGM